MKQQKAMSVLLTTFYNLASTMGRVFVIVESHYGQCEWSDEAVNFYLGGNNT